MRTILAITSVNVPSDICTQRRLKPNCTFAQFDQSVRCPHEETLQGCLSRMRLGNILIRLRERAAGSDPGGFLRGSI